MGTAQRILIACCIGLLAGASCKKKRADQPPPRPPAPTPTAEPPTVAPKIEPEAEAEDAPRPAVADLPPEDKEPDAGLPPPAPRTEEEYRVGTRDGVQLIRLYSDRFAERDRRDRVLAYHMARAVLAGRDIAFDQIHRDALEVRQLLECVLRNRKLADSEVEHALRAYHVALGVHGGFYDRTTGQKFIPEVAFGAFSKAVHTARADGAELVRDRHEPVEAMLARLRPVMFDPDHESTLRAGRTRNSVRIGGTHLNLYHDVTRKALRRFEEHYPHNSRLISIDGRLIEEVFRTGDRRRRIPPGRYARELRRVLRRLHAAVASAARPQRLMLADLIEHFRSGDPFAMEAARRKWQGQTMEVEFILGFLDRGLDPRGIKGLWLGLVGLLDRPATSRLETLLREIQKIENRMPWPEKLRKRWREPPRAVAVELLTGAGRPAPVFAHGFRLPPDRAMGERHAAKLLLFVNVVESHRQAVLKPLVREFTTGERRERLLGLLEQVAWARSALREILGRELGQVSSRAGAWLQGDLAAVEALKADLVALWLLGQPEPMELGLVREAQAGRAAWDLAVVEAAVCEALDPQRPIVPAARARRVWIRGLVEQEVVGFETPEGQEEAYPVILDEQAFEKSLTALLGRCEQILAEADISAARALMRSADEPAAWPERTGLAERARRVGLRRIAAYVMPKIRPRRGADGSRIEEATISFVEGLAAQLMRVSRY